MIKLSVKIKPKPHLTEQAAKQMPFALSLAIRNTAEDARKAEYARMGRIFTVRRPKWVFKSIKHKPQASKRQGADMHSKLAIDPPGGMKRADIIAKFERGGQKIARQAPMLSIPVGVRRTKAGIISKANRPEALGFTKGARNRPQKGRKRTYLIPRVGIFQRVGRGKRAKSRMLYHFQRSVPIPKVLGFVDTVKRTVARTFGRHFSEAFKRAMRTAR